MTFRFNRESAATDPWAGCGFTIGVQVGAGSREQGCRGVGLGQIDPAGNGLSRREPSEFWWFSRPSRSRFTRVHRPTPPGPLGFLPVFLNFLIDFTTGNKRVVQDQDVPGSEGDRAVYFGWKAGQRNQGSEKREVHYDTVREGYIRVLTGSMPLRSCSAALYFPECITQYVYPCLIETPN